MKKKRNLWIILAMLVFGFKSIAADYYVSDVTGHDDTGNGTLANPWKTLQQALTLTPAGENVINLDAGTYNVTSTCYIQLGVDLKGAGKDSTFINFTGSGKAIGFYSGADEAGNNILSDLTIDGNNGNLHGIEINSRSNITIDGVRVKNCTYSAIFAFSAMGSSEPLYYLKNIVVKNSDFIDCGSIQSNYIGGSLQIGNVDGLEFFNNRIEQINQIAYGFKFCADGFYKNCKIFNNYIRVKEIPDGYPWAGTGFAIEIFRLLGNNEIYNNDINGIISLVGGSKGTSTNSVWVHDNKIIETPDNVLDFAVECVVQDIEVDHNYIYLSGGSAFVFWDTGNGHDYPAQRKNMRLHHNVVEGSGSDMKSALAFIPSWNAAQIDGVKFYNNTVYNTRDGIGLQFDSNGDLLQNIEVKNNIFMNISGSVYKSYGSKMPSATLFIQNNINYNYGTYESHSSGTPQITSSGNINGVTPQLKLYGGKPTPYFEISTAESPAVNAGLNLGYSVTDGQPDIGAYEYTTSGVAVPTTPSNLNVEINANNQVVLTWSDNADNEDGFCIQRQTDSGLFSQVGTVGANVTCFTDITVALSTTYTYKILAYNTGGNSLASNSETITTPAPDSVVGNIDKSNANKIICIGNSITYGSDGGYRGYLYNSLVNGGYTFTFAGTQHEGDGNNTGGQVVINSPYDYMEAYPGIKVDDLNDVLFDGGTIWWNGCSGCMVTANNVISTEQPNIVILMGGTNDLIQGSYIYMSGTTNLDKLQAHFNAYYAPLVDKILDASPDVNLFLMQLTPMTSATNFADDDRAVMVPYWNTFTSNLVTSLQAQDKKVYLISNSDVTLSDISDGVHPRQSGYQKVAANIYAAIQLNTIGGDGNISVTDVLVSQSTVSLVIGSTKLLTATILPSIATNKSISWSSSNTSVATVNSDGLVTAVGEGSVDINVTTQDGNFTNTVKVYVTSSTLSTRHVTDLGNRNVEIYPNPVINGVLYITNAEIENVDIVSISGQKYNVKIDGGKINLKSFEPGIYIVQIPFEGKLFNKKIVVE